MINCQAISKVYQQGTRRIVALDGIDLRVQSSERVAVLGRSGSGKSSLLNLRAALDRPTSGTIEIDGLNLATCKSRALARFRRDKLGVVFQSFRLITHRTAFENVEFPMILRGVPRRERRIRVLAALEQVGLHERANHRPEELSGGEQQRVAIARAIVNQPRLLLADEPTGNLDSNTADQVLLLLERICNEAEMTLLVITHDETVAQRLAQRTLRLNDGRIVEDTSQRTQSSDLNVSSDGLKRQQSPNQIRPPDQPSGEEAKS